MDRQKPLTAAVHATKVWRPAQSWRILRHVPRDRKQPGLNKTPVPTMQRWNWRPSTSSVTHKASAWKVCRRLEEEDLKRGGQIRVQGLHPFFAPLLPLHLSVVLVPSRLFLQFLRRAEGLVHVGRKLLHLVVHQQVLRQRETTGEELFCYSSGIKGTFYPKNLFPLWSGERRRRENATRC